MIVTKKLYFKEFHSQLLVYVNDIKKFVKNTIIHLSIFFSLFHNLL